MLERKIRNRSRVKKSWSFLKRVYTRVFFEKLGAGVQKKIENDLIQQIEKEDTELNEAICAQRMTASNRMDKIWER